MGKENPFTEKLLGEHEHPQLFLRGKITIHEKLHAPRLILERKGNSILLMRRGEKVINEVDLAIDDSYQKAFDHFKKLESELINSIPLNYKFGFTYFPSDKPGLVLYENMPTLILTDVRKTNGKNTTKLNEDSLHTWAKVFHTDYTKPIFSGILTESQRNLIGNAATSGANTNVIFEVLDKQPRDAEGFYIKGDFGVSYFPNPQFYKRLDEIQNTNPSRDFYDLLLCEISDHLNEWQVKKIFNSTDPEIRYLENACAFFESFVNVRNIEPIADLSLLKPPTVFNIGNIGLNHIPSNKTVALLESNDFYAELFRVVVATFRKQRKAVGLLTESAVNNINRVSSIISDAIITEATDLPSFLEYRNFLNEAEDYTDIEQPTDILKTVSSIQKAFDTAKHAEIPQGEGKVLLVIAGKEFLDKDFVDNVFETAKDNNIIFAVLSPTNYENGLKYNPSPEILLAITNAIKNGNNNIVDVISISADILEEILPKIRPKYEPTSVIVPEIISRNIISQMYMEEIILGGRLGLTKNFKVLVAPEKNWHEMYRSLEDNDFATFEKITPKYLHTFWDFLLTEVKNWRGEPN